jgi:hypothetical protein
MRTRPLLIAISVGAAFQLVYQLVALGLTYLLVYPTIQEILDSPFGVPGGGPTQVINLSFVTSIAGLCLAPLAYAAIGFIYAFLHHREDPISPDHGAVGGAAASGAARALSGVLGILITTIVTYFWLTPSPLIAQTFGDAPPDALVIGLLGSTAGGFISLCFGVLFASFIGALGGGLGALFLNR